MPVDFGFAQARAQARHGSRPTGAHWRVVEASDDLTRFLHSLRGSSLGPLVRHFSAASSPHAIERSLRRAWRAEVDAASRWTPDDWRASVEWTAWLPDLSAISHLLRGEPALFWMREDPVLSPFALDDADARRQLIEESFGAIEAGDETDLGRWWYRRWRQLNPVAGNGEAGIEELVAALRNYRRTILAGTSSAIEPRHRLELRVIRLMHLRLRQPVVVFCHLVLTALDLYRIRGGLVRRSLGNVVAGVAQ